MRIKEKMTKDDIHGVTITTKNNDLTNITLDDYCYIARKVFSIICSKLDKIIDVIKKCKCYLTGIKIVGSFRYRCFQCPYIDINKFLKCVKEELMNLVVEHKISEKEVEKIFNDILRLVEIHRDIRKVLSLSSGIVKEVVKACICSDVDVILEVVPYDKTCLNIEIQKEWHEIIEEIEKEVKLKIKEYDIKVFIHVEYVSE